MKNYIKYLFASLILVTGCEIDEQVNPNSPAVNNIISGATSIDLNNIVTGSLAAMRTNHSTYVTASGTLARELYLFDADPRNRTDLLGTNVSTLDNNTFYTTGPWNSRYRTIKNLNILLEAADNAIVTDAQKNGYKGFANTLLAHQFLMLINAQNENGIRIDVADPDNLGPIVNKSAAFTRIQALLDEAETQLAGADFAFNLTTGFAGFDTPSTFLEFNRALAARVELYLGNGANALTELQSSFFDLNGDLTVGPKMVFSNTGADVLNGLFKAPNQNGDQIVVNNGFINDAEAGDLRVANKTAPRETPTTLSGVGGTHETRLFASSTSPIDIIRNEELILIYAEANLMTDNLSEAEAALDVIRTAAGLDPIATAKPTIVNNKAGLIDEMLNQRRYSLWSEGHRMIDLRRY
ncbi:RagB/SusD family nutrient uptake outer membrane protein, partial [Fulvivirga lutimaris]|uniref:RagB/SusD family nutrient uptake outer membrane protein n=1 Tax=Fulvivirga lutimaris TaxID=1819566 RepID=UPI0012BBC5D0